MSIKTWEAMNAVRPLHDDGWTAGGGPGPDKPRCVRHEPGDAYTRQRDGEPADLLNMRDYPVASRCLFCKAKIVTYGMFGRAAEWFDDDDDDSHPEVQVRDFRANR